MELNSKALEKLTRARGVMILQAPFYATIALATEFVEKPAIETMATDGKHIFFNARFVDEMTDAETRGVIAHEVMHIANLHHTRRGNRDPEFWNRACDYAINPGLISEGFALPSGVLNSAEFAGQSAEQIYNALQAKSQQGQQPGQQPGQQQGQQGHGIGGVLDAAPQADPAAMQAAEMQAKALVMQAGAVAKARLQESDGGKRACDEIRAASVNWCEVLRRYVDSAARTEFQWARPNRRFLHAGIYLPGKVKDSLGKLAVVIDTSGSIDKAALSRFMSELQSAVDETAPESVEILQCDARLQARQEFGFNEKIEFELKGGGLTDMQPALDAITDCAACIVFTDCDYPRELKAPPYPVLFVKWGNCKKADPKFGETIRIE